jgi:hypothetical protein
MTTDRGRHWRNMALYSLALGIYLALAPILALGLLPGVSPWLAALSAVYAVLVALVMRAEHRAYVRRTRGAPYRCTRCDARFRSKAGRLVEGSCPAPVVVTVPTEGGDTELATAACPLVPC